ncbi:hypothetical protein [Candidatus Nanohalobium constans]|uniref:Uncharacterized protein n=1 Tax=Candidatus Nanohalobium constans TaxID=2565781 RepID=A0A5Q0UFH9_9ARCH|nr:hypothetical protein [Candidatus Nanohalobium constans]QGA80373.1 hypothetical protein LC1Nh_0473 [Candidatus Nanohalobium constans]
MNLLDVVETIFQNYDGEVQAEFNPDNSTPYTGRDRDLRTGETAREMIEGYASMGKSLNAQVVNDKHTARLSYNASTDRLKIDIELEDGINKEFNQYLEDTDLEQLEEQITEIEEEYKEAPRL